MPFKNFDEEIIQFFANIEDCFHSFLNVFVMEYLQEKSKYLYKILVETLRKHNLVAFDAKHYVFFSQDVIFPDQKGIEMKFSTPAVPITHLLFEEQNNDYVFRWCFKKYADIK